MGRERGSGGTQKKAFRVANGFCQILLQTHTWATELKQKGKVRKSRERLLFIVCFDSTLFRHFPPPVAKTQQEEHKMLHGLRRWAKITDSLLLPPLLLHEVIHVERESALRRPFGSVLTECESLPAHGSQMYTKVPQSS